MYILYNIIVIKETGYKCSLSISVISTSIIYYHRIYLKYYFYDINRSNYTQFNPYLCCPTVLYLASKVEEYSIHLDTILNNYCSELIRLEGPTLLWSKDNIYECESQILELMNFDLIIYHPYNYFNHYLKETDLDKTTYNSILTIINDSYYTPLLILYPPEYILLSSIYIVCVYIERDFTSYLKKYSINLDDIYFITSIILQVYNRNNELNKPILSEILKKFQNIYCSSCDTAIKNYLDNKKLSVLK